jgi:multisubunit Na+/H+ antiporter MnhG subunit
MYDIAIWILLFAAFGFAVLGFFGLLIFPDIKSRMFTATRATLIAAGLVIVSAFLYGINASLMTGQEIYTTLLIHTALLAAVLLAGTIVVTRIISGRIFETIPPLEVKN